MRIIAGKYKGKILNDFSHSGTRPTSDKARGGIFNTLIYEIIDGVILDLFGGTGAMGIEAESRGAKKVYIVDNSFDSIKNIKDNCKKCMTQNIEIIKNDYIEALKYFKKLKLKFDVIFIDPPYKEEFAKTATKLIMDYQLLNENGIICYEHDTNNFVNDKRLIIEKERKYGIAYVTYYKALEG